MPAFINSPQFFKRAISKSNLLFDTLWFINAIFAAAANIAYMQQNTANKRLDFEIARLKNCGELMKAGIMFHKNSPYFAVCADVVLVNPPGTLPQHSHSIQTKPIPNGDASSLKTISIGNSK